MRAVQTKHPHLAYVHLSERLWRLVDLRKRRPVGPPCASERELVNDLDRQAKILKCVCVNVAS